MAKKTKNITLINPGPKSKRGKAIASKNALTHGLTAKKWLDNNEQESYQSLLEAFVEEYQPVSSTEHVLVEKLAGLAVRLNRFQKVEDNLFELAREDASSSDKVVESFGFDEETEKTIAFALNGVDIAKYDIPLELIAEIIEHAPDKITGYVYVKENMPAVRKQLIKDCHLEKCDIDELITHLSSSDQITHTIRFVSSKEDEIREERTLSDEELDASGLKVSAKDLESYCWSLYDKYQRLVKINDHVSNRDKRADQLRSSALPDLDKQDKLMRYQTSLERQFSKTLGELLHIIDRRKFNEKTD